MLAALVEMSKKNEQAVDRLLSNSSSAAVEI
jgi:hypothetical protein